ncbi:helix-turn-helix domain-containing protein [Lentilactobacillus parabuchneri]|uniref:Helix-turn-helix domain-containing protein n=1 Tax=Lentilactobacillus parabuchneri TaxID=152331 RepID=A0A844EJE0_9LACO|nr:helix-turn-helix transcriptional regulator [Lentilactobacillus parabuchneri]MDB1104710.1 helix-turn-helix transcriptional regulator [Lentilactobacillus parabuchneri]MSE19760.1 helix-turn-helix domain-containing protein [Lentilactobacillus parabuchneri]
MWDRIQLILDQKHLTINKLATLMSLKSNSVLYSFKNGKIKKPSFELMEKIADALNISMDEFRRR